MQLGSGHGRSIGKQIVMPSALTGLPLVYFVPDPIIELASWLRSVPECSTRRHESVAEPAWLFVSYLTRARGASSANAQSFAKLYERILLGNHQLQTTNSLILLAGEITSKAKLRQQMAFAGGATPSTAAVLYPPHSQVPALLDSLSEFLAGNLNAYDPLEVAALVGYSAVIAHPFDDGNGRWSRVLSVYAGMRAGSAWNGITAALFQTACLPQVVRLWEFARTNGLAAYFEASRNFDGRILNACVEAGIMRPATKIGEALLDKIQNRKTARQIAFELFSTGQLTEVGLRQRLCCSQRKAAGIRDALLEDSSLGFLPTPAGVVSMLPDQAVEIVKNAEANSTQGEEP